MSERKKTSMDIRCTVCGNSTFTITDEHSSEIIRKVMKVNNKIVEAPVPSTTREFAIKMTVTRCARCGNIAFETARSYPIEVKEQRKQ